MALYRPHCLYPHLLCGHHGVLLFILLPRLTMSKGKEPRKVKKVMHEFKERTLHSGSKKGPVVSNPKQAVAIALSEARKSGAKIPKKK